MDEINSSGDVITEQQVPVDSVTVGETAETPAPPEQETQQVAQEAAPPRDDFWKNRAMELERKTQNLEEKLPQIIEETLKKNQQPQQPQYTEAQLKTFLRTATEMRDIQWAEEQLTQIEERKLAEREQRIVEQVTKQYESRQSKAQAEATVLNDPRYADAFVTMPNGQRGWNPQSKMAQLMGAYMNDSRLKDQPDAILIAARLARADILDSQQPVSSQQIQSLKRQAEQLKTRTMVEGGGAAVQQTKADGYTSALTDLARTGREADARRAVAEYFKKKQSG